MGISPLNAATAYWMATRWPASSKGTGYTWPAFMNPSTRRNSGTMSYGPPVWPDKPFASATAVMKTIVSRMIWMFFSHCSRCSGVSFGWDGSSLRRL